MTADKHNLKKTVRDLSKYSLDIVKQTNEALNQLGGRVDQMAEVLNAVVQVLGVDSVDAMIKETRETIKAQAEAQQADGVKQLVDKRIFVPAQLVTADGFIVGSDVAADGAERRVQFEMTQIGKEFLSLYTDKRVGDTIESNGAKLVIKELYTIDKVRYAEVVAEEKKKDEEAKKAAEAPVPPVVNAPPPPAPKAEAPVVETVPADDADLV
jgi:hypothetical protein